MRVKPLKAGEREIFSGRTAVCVVNYGIIARLDAQGEETERRRVTFATCFFAD